MQRFGGQGVIEEGLLKGRKFIIPAEVYVEKGVHISGQPEYSKACLIHQRFVPDQGCEQCRIELEEEKKVMGKIGL